ncbi:hypothetical protein HDA32_001531 [Spinactinospora alkalitolerans]|uniref:DUF3558 domain-containing protein n=1 Tax=Spinactinospora alkalitolerans TaxID=687207 RepID=A0A852TS42_9ACTN|nr:hypothetical protein [Spinactinospora alkalitolerans]NYE46411.1 hypothetical protein [Spinactinospora alkalitolerans]
MAQPPYGGPPQGPYGSQPPGPGGPQGPPPPPGPGGPQGPYGPNPYLSSPQPRKSNGCAIAAIIGVVIVVVLAIAIVGVVFLASGDDSGGTETGGGGSAGGSGDSGNSQDAGPSYYTTLPDCSIGEGASLSTLVPDYQRSTDEAMDTGGQDWWDGRECAWQTGSGHTGMPAFGYLQIMRNDDRSGVSGAEETETDLETASEGYATTPVDGLGDEAQAWYDTEGKLGCVGVRMSNMYFTSCYDQATDYAFEESVPEQEAIDGAEDLAREAADAIATGGY